MKKIFICLLSLLLFSSQLFAEQLYEVYFTSPGKTKSSLINPEKGLINAIRNSKTFFFGAFYDISSMNIAHELINAHKRGVEIKLVTDNDTFSGGAIDALIENGIAVETDNSAGLMHNKFAVIDGTSVFTGSYNTTDNCSQKNNNNALLIRSTELSSIYLAEFNEMFLAGIYGNRREEGAFSELMKKYYVKLGDIDINAYFAPEDNIEKILYGRLLKAKKSIRFMQFSFTSDTIGELIIEKFKQGIRVEGVFEKKGSGSEYSEYVKMKIEGLPVRTDRNINVMHHKVIIIDDEITITGSYNISKNANTRNDENILIIHNPGIAAIYTGEFDRVYGTANHNE